MAQANGYMFACPVTNDPRSADRECQTIGNWPKSHCIHSGQATIIQPVDAKIVNGDERSQSNRRQCRK